MILLVLGKWCISFEVVFLQGALALCLGILLTR